MFNLEQRFCRACVGGADADGSGHGGCNAVNRDGCMDAFVLDVHSEENDGEWDVAGP